ncbi:MAG: hypothetical protein MZW92_01835 [Comamonadaceae bacterium]|nr:hypothetical protein [Comamonadaceae bacterium]
MASSTLDQQLALCEAWHLPNLLLTLMNDAQANNPRVRNVVCAVSLGPSLGQRLERSRPARRFQGHRRPAASDAGCSHDACGHRPAVRRRKRQTSTATTRG